MGGVGHAARASVLLRWTHDSPWRQRFAQGLTALESTGGCSTDLVLGRFAQPAVPRVLVFSGTYAFIRTTVCGTGMGIAAFIAVQARDHW